METKRKECKVVMLPTEDNSVITMFEHDTLKYNLSLQEKMKGVCGWTNQHLYIISDDKIKEDDWFVWKDNNQINQAGSGRLDLGILNKHLINRDVSKIIATTDKSLKLTHSNINSIKIDTKDTNLLSQPSKAFIEKYCKVGGIDKVMVEYEYDELETKFRNAQIKGRWAKYLPENGEFKLKTNSHNEITIHPIKNSYSREEVINLLDKFNNHEVEADPFRYGEEFDKWIKENL